MANDIPVTERATAYDEARREANTLIGILKESEQEFRSEHSELLKAIEESKAKADALEAELREAALEYVKATGDKEPAPGVGVRMMTRYQYDEAAAFEWAETFAPELITLNTKGFEKQMGTLVKGKQNVPQFVSVEEEPTITLSKSLGAAS